jgi:hypothetical protein
VDADPKMNLIERLRKLEAKATPGPWYHQWSHGAVGISKTKNRAITPYVDRVEDAEFIAEMRNALPKLLDVVKIAQLLRDTYSIREGCRASLSLESLIVYSEELDAVLTALEEKCD